MIQKMVSDETGLEVEALDLCKICYNYQPDENGEMKCKYDFPLPEPFEVELNNGDKVISYYCKGCPN